MADHPPTLSLIVAVAENGVIGRAGGLPWRLSSDLKRFRRLTMGHPLIMGRKTYAAIGKPLDGRDNIVVIRRPSGLTGVDGLVLAGSFEEALKQAKVFANQRSVHEIFVIGGALLFDQALPLADRIYATIVHGRPEGDAFWPLPATDVWRETSRESRPGGVRDDYAVTDAVLERKHRLEASPQG